MARSWPSWRTSPGGRSHPRLREGTAQGEDSVVPHQALMPKKSIPRPSKPSEHVVRDAGDALYRAAKESCRQHDRLTRLVALGADDEEFNAAWDLAELCDAQLATRTTLYEETAAMGRGGESEEWWRAANSLWMASRDYGRRHESSNEASARRKRHGAAELGEITLEYELEASARLSVKQAMATYLVLRPDAV
jgi:hypothetical protein